MGNTIVKNSTKESYLLSIVLYDELCFLEPKVLNCLTVLFKQALRDSISYTNHKRNDSHKRRPSFLIEQLKFDLNLPAKNLLLLIKVYI